MKIIIAMMGSRMHYAVPEILFKNNLLYAFYTDSYIGNKPVFENFLEINLKLTNNHYVKKWLSRKSPVISPKYIKSFEIFALRYFIARKLGDRMEQIHSKYNKIFCRKIIENLKAKKQFDEFDAIYGFNTASLELFKFFKQKNKFLILEQTMLPYFITKELLLEEKKLWKGWQDNLEIGDDDSLSERELLEYYYSDIIICPSSFVKEGLLKLNVPSEKIVIIPYGVNLDLFKPIEKKYTFNLPLKILFVGEVGLRKGVPYLLEALKKIGKNKVSAKFIGPININKDKLKPYFEVAEFVGIVPKQEVLKFYQWADIFVFPSISEGSATVTYEALACGLPIITTPNSGSLVLNGEDGFVVPSRDVESLKDAIVKYLDSPELIYQHRENIVQKKHKISIERYSSDLLNFISSIEKKKLEGIL